MNNNHPAPACFGSQMIHFHATTCGECNRAGACALTTSTRRHADDTRHRQEVQRRARALQKKGYPWAEALAHAEENTPRL